MAITLQLNPEQEANLRAVADKLHVSPEALAETAVRNLLALPDEEFLRVAKAIVEDHRELYERLR
jgi:predicted transcriptional regulator